jgi:putative glutamine amidotransferase
MRPIIGITADKAMEDGFFYEKLNETNIRAVTKAGGAAIMLPITDDDEIIEKYMELIDGLYLTGGGDINPLIFGEEPIKQLGAVDYDRDVFEIKLCKKAAEKNIPMLGVCRGQQIMNVAAGGTLYQDIYVQHPGANGHSPRFAPGGFEHHSVDIKSKTKLHCILGNGVVRVNSFHHQAVRDAAAGYTVGAYSKDGIIEAIESDELAFAVGVQWHPEVMMDRYPEVIALYRALIEAAENYTRTKTSNPHSLR